MTEGSNLLTTREIMVVDHLAEGGIDIADAMRIEPLLKGDHIFRTVADDLFCF